MLTSRDLLEDKRPECQRTRPLLEVVNLSIGYRTRAGLVRAVDGVSLALQPGESMGIVGESGSGKSTLVMSFFRLLPPDKTEISGAVFFNGTDVLHCSQEDLSKIRWKQASIVFQKSMNSLSPVHKVIEQVEDIYRVHAPQATRNEIMDRILHLFKVVNLTPRVLDLYPHELSGGMLQRVSIALSLVHLPKLVVFDEATTALDVITQAQILDEVSRLQRELDLTSIIVTHDISVVARTCERVVVMYAGRLVELGDVSTVLGRPLHPYTEGLIRSFPSLGGPRKRITGIPGSLPDLRIPVPGCIFAPRCPDVLDICGKQSPRPVVVPQGRAEKVGTTTGVARRQPAGFPDAGGLAVATHVVACHKYGGGDE